ncbi:YcaO-like family protein [Micromonospora chokoriensis]
MSLLSGSVRDACVEQTVDIASTVARRLGITRCAETTWLDRVGIPVYSAVRPRAGIVCVTAGKGQLPLEARVGALMEGIEQAVAELAGMTTEVRWSTPEEVVAAGGPTVASLCPRIDRPIAPNTRMAWVDSYDVAGRGPALLPAELVFIPCPPELQSGHFTPSTTGLASGNSIREAALHGLCEVLERDTTTICELVNDPSRLVTPASLPPDLAHLHERIEAAGLRVWLRYMPTVAGTPYFRCLIVDDEFPTPAFCHGGYGSHPVAKIAASRAITEAAQSRLTFIQGGRDDLTATVDAVNAMTPGTRRSHRQSLITQYARAGDPIAFDDIPTVGLDEPDRLLADLASACESSGLGKVLVHSFAEHLADPLVVVRVVVPYAEHWSPATRRVGPRLLAGVRANRIRAGGPGS